jgi:hypothetical protein
MSVTYEVMVDWDATDWLATPDFSEAIDDITRFVKKVYTDRGKNVELGNSPAGTIDILLNNTDKRFSPPYAAGPLFGKIRPWLPVRVRATVTGGSALPYFTGFISRISINAHIDVQEAMLFCTDGMDLLARNMVANDSGDREMITDGAAIGKILDASGWPSSKRSIETDTPAILNFPKTTEY